MVAGNARASEGLHRSAANLASRLPPKWRAPSRSNRTKYGTNGLSLPSSQQRTPAPSLLLPVERGYKKFQKRFVRERVLT